MTTPVQTPATHGTARVHSQSGELRANGTFGAPRGRSREVNSHGPLVPEPPSEGGTSMGPDLCPGHVCVIPTHQHPFTHDRDAGHPHDSCHRAPDATPLQFPSASTKLLRVRRTRALTSLNSTPDKLNTKSVGKENKPLPL